MKETLQYIESYNGWDIFRVARNTAFCRLVWRANKESQELSALFLTDLKEKIDINS